ncbi:VOC family protein [Nocardioides sp. HDW12B]|uniref:VOC family protein n=1 Tax=Nocardioides sp. HDW12B TaxID=2714939 RepID=UPI00140A77AA|nr:VOC family protein [Nocardioides sp. HDW12B]QIK65918.1 VOC family protein [Nocardioides sp. HDW12B]
MAGVPVDPGAAGMAFVAVHDLDRALAFYVDTLGSSLVEAPTSQRPEVCVVRAPGDPGHTRAALSVTLVQVSTPRDAGASRADGDPTRDEERATTEVALQADIELARVDDAVVDDAGLWRTPQGDVVTWFRDQAGGISSLAHRAA